MKGSTINIEVQLNEQKSPQSITWEASDSTLEKAQVAKAMLVSFWDSAEKTAMRIDLWTQDMMVDEMGDFFYQTMMTMADTYQRATRHNDIAQEMKNFAMEFYRKSRAKLQESQKA